jgi:hypothetical protein
VFLNIKPRQEISAMTIYTAQFRTDADYAEQEFKARTAKQALALARKFYDEHDEDLLFQSYDGGGSSVNEIEISGPEGSKLAVWQDDELRLRLAASDVLDALEAQTDAAQAVIDAWAEGDLAGAVRALDGSISAARAAIAKAKGAG